MDINKIKPNPKNPRIIRDEKFIKLVKSIKSFPEMMAKRPMVCVTDIDGKIFPLGGNMRLLAIKEVGYKEIPDEWVVMVDDWSEEKRNEFIIKDNISFGEWDYEILANEWDAENLSEWGVDQLPQFPSTINSSVQNLSYFERHHVLISYHPDLHEKVLSLLEIVQKEDGVEIETSAN